MKKTSFIWACVLILFSTVAVLAQEPPGDKVSLTFRDPARPGLLKAGLMRGGITVRGHDGREVVVEASLRGGESRGTRQEEATVGMKRIQNATTGLSVTEDNNVIDVDAGSFNRAVDLSIQVPRRTSLKLDCMNDGDVNVENVQGEIEVSDLNGSIKLTGVGGSAVVHTMNGAITIVFNEVSPDKPMSFSSMNGNIDVTFPATLKGNIVMQSQNGEIYTDFDIRMDARAREPIVEDAREKGGKYRIRVEKAVQGNVNGGGPEIRFKTFNGDVYIRKAGAK